MKKIVLVAIVSLLTTSAIAAQEIPKWMEAKNWTLLKKWMTPQQVTNTLGNPLYKDSNPQAGIWYYQETPRIENAKIILPSEGLVKFRRVTAGYVVMDWKEPDWEKVTQFLAQQKELQQQKGLTPEELEAARKEAERIEREKKIAEEEARQAELERQRIIKERQEAEKAGQRKKKNCIIGGCVLAGLIGLYIVFSKSYS